MEITDDEIAAIRAVRRFFLTNSICESHRVSDQYSMILPAQPLEIAEIKREREQLKSVAAVLDRIVKAVKQ